MNQIACAVGADEGQAASLGQGELGPSLDGIALSLLQSTLIVDGSTTDPEAYFRELQQDVASRLAHDDNATSLDGHLASIPEQWRAVAADLSKPDVFESLDIGDLDDVSQYNLLGLLRFVRGQAPLAKGEDSPFPNFELGVSARAAGPIAAGTVIIRKTGRAVSHYVIPELRVEASGRSLVQVDETALSEMFSLKDVEIAEQIAESRALPLVFIKVAANIGKIIKAIPWKNIVASIGDGKLDIGKLIAGLTGEEQSDPPPTLDEIRNAVREVVQEIVADTVIHDEVSHVHAFLDLMSGHQAGLEAAVDKSEYIKNYYLVTIRDEILTVGAGKVRNSVSRLKTYHAQQKDNNYPSSEKFLGPITLGISTLLLIHRTHVLLYSALAGFAKKAGNLAEHDRHLANARIALALFQHALERSDFSANYLFGIMDKHLDLVRDIDWDRYQDWIVSFVYQVKHKAKNDEVLDRDRYSFTEQGRGETWARDRVSARKSEYWRTAYNDTVSPAREQIWVWRRAYNGLHSNLGVPSVFGFLEG